MKKRYSSLMKMFISVQVTIAKFIAEWTGLLSFEEVNTRFNDKKDSIDEYTAVRAEALKGYTAEKIDKRLAMCLVVVATAKKLKAYATIKRDQPLLVKMKQAVFTTIMRHRITTVMPIVDAVVAAANSLTPAEKTAYGIDMTVLNAVVKDFVTVLTLPRDKVVVRTNATKKLIELYKETESLLIEEMDNLMANFEGDFLNEYRASRRIIDEIKHTAIKGNVANEQGVDLYKVAVKLTGRDKQTGEEKVVFEEMTNKDGNFAKSAINPELSWDVEFTTPDYQSKKFTDIDLERGTIDRLEVQLVPKV